MEYSVKRASYELHHNYGMNYITTKWSISLRNTQTAVRYYETRHSD